MSCPPPTEPRRPGALAPGRVVLGSANPAKRHGVRDALAAAFPEAPPQLTWHDVPSGVPDQPWGDGETLRGARRRAAEALRLSGGDDAIGVGIEGGVAREGGRLWSFSWAVALTSDGASGAARSAAFVLPLPVTRLVEDGLELGDAVDRVFAVEGSKHAGGAVGLLTRGAVERRALYAHAVLLALVPILRRELYAGDPGDAGG